MSWFSRAQAENGLKNANTATLRNALTNYINATKNMNANAIRKALNNTRIGMTDSYKNRIVNGVANAVIKARKAKGALNAANAGAVSEPVAAEAVRQAETAMNNLNRAIVNINTTNFANNAAKNMYKTKLMNIVKAKGIALNNARLTAAFNKINAKAFKKAKNSANQRPANTGAAVQQATNAMNNLNRAIANINTTNFANNAAKESYRTKLMNIAKAKKIALNNARLTAAFNKINAKAFKKANNSANQRPANQRPANQSQAPPAAVNNRFKNMNINTLVKSAAQSLSMSKENKVKLKAAMKAKINTLNENSMNRVRLVNANRNLN